MRIKWLGHAGFKLDDLLIDPWMEDIPQWHLVKPYEYTELDKQANVMVITHNHFDHLQGAFPVAKEYGITVVGIVETIMDAMKMGCPIGKINIGGTITVHGWKISLVPAFHSGNPSGVVAEKDGIVVYHAGDTGYSSALFSDIQRLYHPSIALLPIGGTFTMNEEQAALAVEDLGVQKVIAMHYNTFDLIMADPLKFKHYVQGKAEVIVMKVGEEIEI